jgi:very-short-patch-repair endonuclease
VIIDAKSLPKGSALNRAFSLRWATIPGAPPLVAEHQGIEGRRYRFDFAHPASMTAIEIDGGLWRRGKGGHTSGSGAIRDREKDLLATLAGWTVIRLTPEMSKDRNVLTEIVGLIERRMKT